MSDENLVTKKVEEIESNLNQLKKLGISKNEIIRRYEDKVLALKNNRLTYFFALNMNVANVERYGKMIIDSKDLIWNYRFANAVKGANTLAHQKVVIESKNPEANFLFATNIEGVDIEPHVRIVIESKYKDLNNKLSSALGNKYKVISIYNFIDDALDDITKEIKK